MNKKIQLLLIDLGLSNAEIQVYLELLKLGESKVGQITKRVQISSSNIHEALDKLTKKGLVSFITKNKIRYYIPQSPDNLKLLLNIQKQRVSRIEKELTSTLPSLETIKKIVPKRQHAEIFFGVNGMKSAFKELISGEGKEIIFFHRPDDPAATQRAHKFFAKMDIEDIYAHVPIRGLFSKEQEKFFKKRKYTKVVAKFTDLPMPSNVDIYGDKVLLMDFSEVPIAFLITSREITASFRKLFEEIWRRA